MRNSINFLRRVPRIRASPRHGGARRFFVIFIFFSLIDNAYGDTPSRVYLKITITPHKVDEKFSFETGEIIKGVKGMLPLGCFPL